ncbi:hypothetical protein [Hymenobacter terrenus]|uniref:hypothetical protein n=1 Tax=Hymenobacter terrenus TaxID=1629124 RepID=UPI0012E007F2|nr:hypothetical protein [Hymenobacter terrenus]
MNAKVIFYSVAIWVGSFLLWGALFFWQWTNIVVLAKVAAAFVALGIFSFFPHLLAASTATQAGMAMASVAGGAAGFGFTILSYAFVVAAFIFLILISVRILLEVFLMKYVQTRTLTRYPQLEKGAETS